MDRRTFVAVSGAAAAGLTFGARAPAKLDRIGVQAFSLPKMLEHDVDATLAMLSGLGYQEIELFGPFPFSVQAVQDQWKAMATSMLGFSGSGYFGLTAAQFRAKLDAHGMTSPSTHIDLDTLESRLDQVAEAAHTLGHQYVGLAMIPEQRRKTLDDYKKMADELNAIGARAQPLGLKILYHNHGYGFTPLEGQVPTRVVFDRLDPSVVSLEMDIFWTVAGGADPVELLDTYPKLYRLMHVKDMSKIGHFTQGGTMQDFMSLAPLMTPDGAGVLDLPKILGHAKKNGVEHFYVEQDLAADPPAQLGTSIRNLRAMNLAS